jgi:N4-gp56 family major capsid protein
VYELRLGAFGVQKEVPANMAADTIRFFRPRRAKKGTATSGPRALNESVPLTPQTGGAAVGYVDCALKQRGDATSMSDIQRAVDLFDTLQVNVKTIGADAALDFDFVCSHAIVSAAGVADLDGTPNPIPAGQTTLYNSNTNFERFCGVVNTLNSGNDFATLAALSPTLSKISRAAHLGMVTRLRGINGEPGVPMIGGRYKALVAPEVLMDLRQDSVWLAAAQYNNTEKIGIDKWVEFTLDGCDFVENRSPFIETTGHYGVYSPDAGGATANNIYSNIYLGQEFFGVPKLSGMRAGSDPKAPSLIILDKPDKADPANQQTIVSWKAFYSAVLLLTSEVTDRPHGGILRSHSTFA